MSELHIVYAEPMVDTCPCCGGKRTRLTRVVQRDGAAHALYYALFVEAPHPEPHVELIVSVGSFAPDATPADREAFALTARRTDTGVTLKVEDATESSWRDVALLGTKLTERAAQAHPRLGEVLELGHHVVGNDAALFRFLSHPGGECATCGVSCALRGKSLS